MNVLNNLSTLFETYRGHDQTLSIIGYGCTMFSGICSKNKNLAKKLETISSQISNSRVVLRLLDDASMLSFTLSYGLGKHEKLVFVRVLNVVNNLASHLYYICEHLAWLGDNKILNINSGLYWLVSTLAWLISLLASIICDFISLKNLLNEFKRKKTNNSKALFKDTRFKTILLKLFENIFYTINCIHWLPPGFLWSGKLSNFKSGLLGVLSVACNLAIKICI